MRVRFEHVSKVYRLGLTRASVPALIVSRLRGRRTRADAADRTLWALRDVSFELAEGESLALVGPNGAGKTTILKLLANITKPTEGLVSVQGRLSALIELGAGFHPELTGRDNVFLNGAILGIGRAELRRRFDEIIEFSQLERFIDTPVKRYSSGMIVRLGFAVASCVDPEVLLVDEVLAVGDAAFSQKCLARIQSLIARGTTLVFVSHNLYLVKAVCQKAVYLHAGRLVHAGTAEDAIRTYEAQLHQDRAAQLAAAPHVAQGPGGGIEITDVSVQRAGGERADGALTSDEPVRVRVAYTAYRDLGPLHFSVFVRRSDGLTCCMARTKLAATPVVVQRGPGVVWLEFLRLQLAGGSYFVEAYALDESDSLVLTPGGRQSDWFTVTGRAVSSTSDAGVFEPMATWAHEPGALESSGTDRGPLQGVAR